MRIRTIELTDLGKISKLHKRIFDSSYFSVHYPDELLRNFFQKLITRNQFRFLAEDENERILGFVIGGLSTQESVDEFIRENKFSVLLVTLKNPVLWLQVIKKIYKKSFIPKKKSRAVIRLYLIGSDPYSHNRGIGSLLINNFEEELRNNGIKLYGLYVKTDNSKAIRFYENRGFKYEFKRCDLISYIKEI